MTGPVHLVYFSPTGTTKKIVEAIASGFGAREIQRYDVTLPGSALETVLKDGVAVIGIPVYAGRVPEVCLERLRGLTAGDLPAVLVALYGNREFEDALVELRDVCRAMGFRIVAAGAFIGEHSYSTPERPIAQGRPDAADLAVARKFGEQVAAKLAHLDYSTPEIDGHVPYRDRVPLGGVAPATDSQRCVLCGQCAEVCPTGVVSVGKSVTTVADHCIMCCACLKTCLVSARTFTHPRIEDRRAMLIKNCSTPKSPKIFL